MTQCTSNAHHLKHDQAVFLALALGNQGIYPQAGSYQDSPDHSLPRERFLVTEFMWDYTVGGEKKSKLHSYLFCNIIQNFPKILHYFLQILKPLLLTSMVAYILKINYVFLEHALK